MCYNKLKSNPPLKRYFQYVVFQNRQLHVAVVKSLKSWLDDRTGHNMNCLTEATAMQKEITDCHMKLKVSDRNLLGTKQNLFGL